MDALFHRESLLNSKTDIRLIETRFSKSVSETGFKPPLHLHSIFRDQFTWELQLSWIILVIVKRLDECSGTSCHIRQNAELVVKTVLRSTNKLQALNVSSRFRSPRMPPPVPKFVRAKVGLVPGADRVLPPPKQGLHGWT